MNDQTVGPLNKISRLEVISGDRGYTAGYTYYWYIN